MRHKNLDSQTIFSHAFQIATSMISLAEAVNYMVYNEIQVFNANYPKPQYLNYLNIFNFRSEDGP